MEQGYFQVYTGNGKGKTTAALGLIMRAADAGMRVYFGQFIKNMRYHEVGTLEKRFPEVTVEQYEGAQGCILGRDPDDNDRRAVQQGYQRALEVLGSGEYDLVILDEIDIALHFGLLSREQALAIIDARPANVELVFTGRRAPDYVIERADLVTEMREVKHYYTQGVIAREGIEC